MAELAALNAMSSAPVRNCCAGPMYRMVCRTSKYSPPASSIDSTADIDERAYTTHKQTPDDRPPALTTIDSEADEDHTAPEIAQPHTNKLSRTSDAGNTTVRAERRLSRRHCPLVKSPEQQVRWLEYMMVYRETNRARQLDDNMAKATKPGNRAEMDKATELRKASDLKAGAARRYAVVRLD
jgi:hypothetical protein